MAQAAAFFDLDRTLIRRSSALALAGSFRKRGLITRRHLVKAAFWQLLFGALGADEDAVRRAAEQGLRVLRGRRPAEIRELVDDAFEPVLKPLVYDTARGLVDSHRARGEPVFVVTTTLQEVAEAIADDLGLDGALGTICEVAPDGTYTGHSLRPMYGAAKADAVRDLARERALDLSASWAYSDGHTDLPLLELVGHPVAVNPDRRLQRIASSRGWPTTRFA